MNITMFALTSAGVGALLGGFAGYDGTRFGVGVSYGLGLIVAAVVLLVAGVLLITGANVFSGLTPYALLCVATMFAAYSVVFWLVRRYWPASRNRSSGDAA